MFTLINTFQFLGGAPLLDVYAQGLQPQPLAELLRMYKISIALETKPLEAAIVAHLEEYNSPSMTTEDLVMLAKYAYEDPGFNLSTSSSIGRLIERKIVVLLPQLIQDGTAKKIQDEGGSFGSQLFSVLIEHFPDTPA